MIVDFKPFITCMVALESTQNSTVNMSATLKRSQLVAQFFTVQIINVLRRTVHEILGKC